jgi:hypothetical protein
LAKEEAEAKSIIEEAERQARREENCIEQKVTMEEMED